jgi:ABC-2 type transport system ATP-binding protein
MEEAEYCHQLILMNRGRLIAQGTPRELRGRYTQPVFELSVPDAQQAVHALEHVRGVEDAAVFGRRVHVTTNAPDAAQLIRSALAARGIDGQIRGITPSLEDIFVSLVRREGGALEG